MPARTAPQLVVEAACALFGDAWRSRMAQSLALHPRTVRRIGRAARLEEPHPVSPGVLAEMAALARASAATQERSSPHGRRHVQCLITLAQELDEAARQWVSTRRPQRDRP